MAKAWSKVPCLDCGAVRFYKECSRVHVRCRACANRHTHKSGNGGWITDSSKWPPEFRKKKSENARKQVLAQGGVPNAKKFKVGDRGPLCVNWKGGLVSQYKRVRTSYEYAEWRRAVFVRDEFSCQCCGEVGGRLHAHHIRSFATYPNERFSLENGITLCQPCHFEVAHQRNSRIAPVPVDLIRGARMVELVN